jgi:hypothetical protein
LSHGHYSNDIKVLAKKIQTSRSGYNSGVHRNFGPRPKDRFPLRTSLVIELNTSDIPPFIALNVFHHRNYVLQYLPVPITDIILMRTTEKDRMEKLQVLMNKVIDIFFFFSI